MPLSRYKQALEAAYLRYNSRRWVHPDPLEFVYLYHEPLDREIVGLIAAMLACGRVAQILRSVRTVLEPMGSSPGRFLLDWPTRHLRRRFAGFRHRFAGDAELVALLEGIAAVVRECGSLEACFASGRGEAGTAVPGALAAFAERLGRASGGACGHLLPDPRRRSACKRYHLYLRWMVRRDDVDPGGWSCVRPSELIVPLDTHMHKIALALGATRRRSPDLRAAIQITEAFRRIAPDDPVRYDFALTRLGIHPRADMAGFLAGCARRAEAANVQDTDRHRN